MPLLSRLSRFLGLLLLLAWSGAGQAAERIPFGFAYIMRAGDQAYEPNRAYTGLSLRDNHRPLEGARLGAKDSRILGRALGLKFALEEVTLDDGQSALESIAALQEKGTFVFLLDLPFAEVSMLAETLASRDVILFNIRHFEDSLRGENCSPVLFHSLPSQAMLEDALAQFLAKKNWRDVLLLEGELDADRVLADTFEASARKFGLDIADRRRFVLSNDPRQRGENNIALLTGDAEFDVIFLADSLGEVGRYIPFNSLDPRPVVGSEGLTPSTWHWTWERHGAPQLNQRFEKLAGRKMTGEDWAAWAAIRVVVEALSRGARPAAADLRAYLTGGDLNFDAYKGEPGSFRPWNNQLRQTILLHTHNAVIARAPIEGYLHQTNTLDSLGDDEPQSACRFP